MSRVVYKCLLLGSLVVALGISATAQEVKDKAEKKNDPDDIVVPFFETHQGFLVRASIGAFFGQHPYTSAALRAQGADNPLLWPEWQIASDLLLPLRPDWLNDIVDDRPMPNLNAKSPLELPKSTVALYQAYSQALVNASFATPEMFNAAAKENEHVTFSHLWEKPNLYRGKVIPLRGRLIKLVKHDAAPVPALEQGVKQFYEGWVVGPTKGANPFVVIFIDAPEGLKPADKMRKNVYFEGFFLTKYRYLTEDDKKHKLPPIAPILIGKTITVEEKAATNDEPYSRVILMYSLLGVIVIVALMLLMAWWFRKGDQVTQKALVDLRDRGVTFELPEATPEAPPLAKPVSPPPPKDGGGVPPPSLN
jgi:hypothetical protein